MKAFIAMPFQPELDWVYDIIIEKCLKYEIEPRRVDKIAGVSNIWEAILHEIDDCDIFIADFSPDPVFKKYSFSSAELKNAANTNVATEAGYARSKDKPIILLTSNSDSLPFDWKVMPAIVYPEDKLNINGVLAFHRRLDEHLKSACANCRDDLKRASVKRTQNTKVEIEPPQIPGFNFLQKNHYSCGSASYTVEEYRHEKTGWILLWSPVDLFKWAAQRIIVNNRCIKWR